MSHILIVEDDRDIAELIRHYLVKAGHTAETCCPRAPRRCRASGSRRPDLLVLDLMLPGLHGLEVCRALRARRGDLPTFPSSSSRRGPRKSDRIAGLELGADDYVTKPFSPKELVARVAALLRRASRPAAARRSR